MEATVTVKTWHKRLKMAHLCHEWELAGMEVALGASVRECEGLGHDWPPQ